MKRPRPVAAAVVAVATALTTAGCIASVPTVSAGPSASLPATRSASPNRPDKDPVSIPRAIATSTPKPMGGLAAELDVQTFDRATTESILDFASTGSSIIFSSGLAEDSGPTAAPDLWRVTPGIDPTPELVWRNPNRDHVLLQVTGDLETVAFVDMPVTGERAWDLWIIPHEGEPLLLDSHPGDEDVPSFVPSISVYEPAISWTAFDRGPRGAVSQLLVAMAPDWTPRVMEERVATEAELWLPSLYGNAIAYTEVVYAPDRRTDERHVYLADIRDPTLEPRRLDESGLATMPLLSSHSVVWKEADRGFNMFNWGRLFRYDLVDGTVRQLGLGPQDYVNHPSAGTRFVAWWGSDDTSFVVYDLGRQVARTIERYPRDGSQSVLEPHVHGDLIAWLYVDGAANGGSGASELRYAWLPNARELDR